MKTRAYPQKRPECQVGRATALLSASDKTALRQLCEGPTDGA